MFGGTSTGGTSLGELFLGNFSLGCLRGSQWRFARAARVQTCRAPFPVCHCAFALRGGFGIELLLILLRMDPSLNPQSSFSVRYPRANFLRRTHPRSGSPNSQELGEPCFLGFCRFCHRITSANTSCHRSHFGSRYTLGCCGHAGLFSLCRISPGFRAFSCACPGCSPRVQGRLPRGKWKS